MDFITKILKIDFIVNATGKKDFCIMALKMPDRKPGIDDLSLCDKDKEVLKNNINKKLTFIDANVICGPYSKPIVPEYILKRFGYK